ncbi:putative MAPEG family protein [Heterostelium album PN500]|uniref:Putative MAPEG family protein n=1 Tax=Heterostelium pallidum (strain ATCC 26659 / Pp 5 / PN500) TaxID=670386 RepID=D3B4K6_HETP5|nr:putative MAPEG family protein [Heterostelium album PN500]EFA84254.1 putative MAPEG family protein [Heterostelium album PN500]|eukprot:XP_020436370.1 putative MAPEG family protein [Heterostelium album PN500]
MNNPLNWVLPDRHVFPSIVAAGAVSMWHIQAFCVKKAREKANIPAPAVTGDEDLERTLVSYQHTAEGLAPVICTTYLCSYFTCPKTALILGSGWVLSRMFGSCKNFCDKEKDCKWMVFKSS